MATLVEKNDYNIIYIKGAPDKLMLMAQFEKTESEEENFIKEHWDRQISEIALRGQRTLAAAYKIVDKSVTTIDHADIQDGIVFLGLAGIIDPPREEVILAVSKCKEAGITVKMITGDHADTARTIARELGIGDGSKALQGKDLEQVTDAEMETAVMEYDVFARTSPEHKLRLVRALQAKGVIVAMPTSAFFSAGASFTPSPVIATITPFACNALTKRSLCSGLVRAKTSYSITAVSISISVICSKSLPCNALLPSPMPSSRAMVRAVSAWSPVIILTVIPASLHLLTARITSSRGGSMMPASPRNTIPF
jgi:hypothetical protein